jgi:hypothetical protein
MDIINHLLLVRDEKSITEISMNAAEKKPRVDGQITGLSGEFFVAAELLKRNLQTSLTFEMRKRSIFLPTTLRQIKHLMFK